MAYVDYNTYVETEKTSGNNSDGVGFFSLKDGEEAIVRIMCDDVSNLDILTVHPITVGQSSFPNRQVNCLRDPREPLDQCPLCSAGNKVKQRVFIKMIKYDSVTGEPSAVVWDRPAYKFVPTIKKYIDEYGPLSNILCKITRTGAKLDTVYTIIPNINPPVNCPRVDNAFEGFNVLGRMVLDKNAQEMVTFVQTGNFPAKTNNEVSSQNGQTNTAYVQQQAQPMNQSMGGVPVNQPVGNMPINQPVDNAVPTNMASPIPQPSVIPNALSGNTPPDNQYGLQRPERHF